MIYILIGVFVVIMIFFMVYVKNFIFQIKNELQEVRVKEFKEQQDSFLKMQSTLNEQLTAILNTVNDNLSKTQSNFNEQFSITGKTINDIKKQLGILEEATRNIQKIGEDVVVLQDILSVPKLRGGFGEYLLEDLLKQIFPKGNYEFQYRFRDGTIVDAIIKLSSRIIPIDSKFPLESFMRMIEVKDESEKKKHKKDFINTLKNRIDEIATKYIKPDEGTFDFALMYIPAENVFYETVLSDTVDKDYRIFNYAISKKVVPVSPNSFYAYLTAIAFGLRGFRIEKQVEFIIGELSKIYNLFKRFYDDYSVLGKHISNAKTKYDETLRDIDKLSDGIKKITSASFDKENLKLEDKT